MLAVITAAALLLLLCASSLPPALSEPSGIVLAGLLAGDAAALVPFLSDITASLPQDEASKQAFLCSIVAEKQLPVTLSFCMPPPGTVCLHGSTASIRDVISRDATSQHPGPSKA